MMATMGQILVVTQLNLKKRFQNLICRFVFQNMRSAGYHEKMIGRTYFGGDLVTQLNVMLYNTIKRPYQPKHLPSDPIKLFKKRFYSIISYAVLRTWRSIAVTRSQFLQRLLSDHAQTAAVWKTIPAYARPSSTRFHCQYFQTVQIPK